MFQRYLKLPIAVSLARGQVVKRMDIQGTFNIQPNFEYKQFVSKLALLLPFYRAIHSDKPGVEYRLTKGAQENFFVFF